MDLGTGNTTITDFSHSDGDKIDLSPYGLTTFSAIQALISTSNGNTVINLNTPAANGNAAVSGSLTLNGVASLSASDFANLTASNVVFAGTEAQYSINSSNGVTTINDTVSGRDGLHTLTGAQQAQFTDYTLTFDLHSSQDTLVYELYQAAYARMPDNAGFRYWAQWGDSTGASATTIADKFLGAAEYTQKYGANPSNTDYVTELYTNVLGRQPDQAGLNYWIGQANGGVPRDQLLVDFAVSNENVQLIGTHVSATTGYWTAH